MRENKRQPPASDCLPKIHAGEVERTCVNIISK
nr:MAG TPA: hypothetical protein [Caudoviricetes sp.]